MHQNRPGQLGKIIEKAQNILFAVEFLGAQPDGYKFHAALFGKFFFGFEPPGLRARTAQIDDALDSVFADNAIQFIRKKLRRAVKLAGIDFMKVFSDAIYGTVIDDLGQDRSHPQNQYQHYQALSTKDQAKRTFFLNLATYGEEHSFAPAKMQI